MLNIQNIIKDPNPTYLEVGKLAFLHCDLMNLDTETCTFYIYRIDDTTKKIDGQKEIIIQGEKDYNGYSLNENVTELKSIQPVSPKLSWFDKDEEEIKAAFDIEVKGTRVKSNDHALIIKKGNITINLYWGEEYRESEIQKVRIYAEYLIREADLNYPNDLGYPDKFQFKINRKSPTLIHPITNWRHSSSETVYEEDRNNRKRKGRFIIAESGEINLTEFFEYFCQVNLLPELLDTDYTMRSDDFYPDKEELKIFKRDFLYSAEEVLLFLRKKKLIPEIYYDDVMTHNEVMSLFDQINKMQGYVDDVKKIIKKRDPRSFFLSRVEDLFKEMEKTANKSEHKYVFFKDEYRLTIRHLKRTENQRIQQFENWLQSMMRIHPHSPEFKEKYLDVSIRIKKYNDLDPRLRDERYGRILNSRINIYNDIIDEYNSFVSDFKTLERATEYFLEKAMDNVDFSF